MPASFAKAKETKPVPHPKSATALSFIFIFDKSLYFSLSSKYSLRITFQFSAMELKYCTE